MRAVLGIGLLCFGASAHAQDAPELQSIPVDSRQIPEDMVEAPAAIGVVDRQDVQLGRQQLSLEESLVKVPGFFLQNPNNFAQDVRISSRGFGARANFGIRGIKVYLDHIPLTLPDGQTSVDAVDLGSIDHIEVMRGPASSLYGASAGGVIHIASEVAPDDPFAEARLTFGDYDFQRYQLKAGGKRGPASSVVSVSHLTIDGYRDHSRTQSTLLNSRFGFEFDESSELGVIVRAVDSPQADDPGALTRSQVGEDRRQAAASNLLYDAGEDLAEETLGLVYRKSFNERHEFTARSYGVHRDFDNKLPFTDGGVVDLGRWFAGGGLRYFYTGEVFGLGNQLSAGLDVDVQWDDRKRYDNNEGARGARVFDQEEDVTATGVYVQNQLAVLNDVTLTAGVRYDYVDFDVDDHFRADGNDSGSIDFDRVSPSAALLWSPWEALNLYASFTTSFETPTTTELANPSGAGGFNSSLDSQTARNYEIGVKGLVPGRVRYGLSLFRVDVKDELIPFEVPSMPGRSFFRNAGRSTREGLELDLSVEPLRGLVASLAYTYSDFTYDRFQTPLGDFAGNDLPGVPNDQIHGELEYRHPSGFYAAWETLYVGGFYADDANRIRNGAYVVSSLRMGHRFVAGPFEIGPFFGVNNVFDEEYNGNVRLNAFAGRSFEPAPERNVYGGFSVRFVFSSSN